MQICYNTEKQRSDQMATIEKIPSILLTIQSKLSEMTKSEAVVCDFILQNPEKIIHYSVAELAEKSGTSGATVIRASRKLNFSSFMALKVALAQDLANPLEGNTKEIDPNSSALETMEYVFQSTIQSINNAYHNLNPALLEQAADALLGANRILIHGPGSALSIAQDLTHKLLRLGLNAICYSDTFYQLYSSAYLKQGDVLFLISRQPDEVLYPRMAEQAKKNGATVILLIDSPTSPSVADITLYSGSAPQTIHLTQYVYQTVQSVIIDTIYVRMALKKGNAAEDFYSMEAVAALYTI